MIPLRVLAVLLFLASASRVGAETFVVENGEPRAEIVIAEQPERTVRLAADDLQNYVQKMSGARLPIVTEPSGNAVKLFVGRSRHTDELGITAEGLKYGAYRLASGDDWIVFIGQDTDFVPREPWPRRNSDIPRLQAAWEVAAGGAWKVPNTTMWKDREKVPATVGLPDAAPPPKKGEFFEYWMYDEQGSYNAVSAFLQSLGVRSLMAGELGEFVPERKSIALPKLDETVHPDFEIRQFSISGPSEWTRWGMRLGVRNPYALLTAHGMSRLATKAAYDAHPDWFAMFGGKRRFDPDDGGNHLCFSNEELFQETLRCVRAQFDVYDYEGVSVMPSDAYNAICQCPLCEGKLEVERGRSGWLSNHVWDFVNRVAKEIVKTHPQKVIYCCAYGSNMLPPTNIGKLEPNVQVVLVGGRRPKSGATQQAEIRAYRESWLPKTDRPIQIYENYPLTSRGAYLPIFMARTIGSSINETKGISRGEEIWISPNKELDGKAAFNMFQYYFTAKAYWGGKQHDPGAALDEYCRLMYGPAGDAMKAFFDYCELNWPAMESDKSKADAALAMFDAAKALVDPSSSEARRLALIDDYLRGLRNKSTILAQKRGVVPKLRLIGEADDIVIDGKLDEPYWQAWSGSGIGRLREVQTGRTPTFGTQVKVGWKDSDLYFAVRCEERPGERPNITATQKGDQAVWYGDVVEFLIETNAHSYYQIAVNPAGAIVDFDRGADKKSWDSWDSQAEVATQIGDGFWTIEIRLPVTEDENDPLHLLVGRKPSTSLPWHFNICRQRVRENGAEFSAFSPTGSTDFHKLMQFAHLHSGLSHDFDADPSVTTYMSAVRAASQLPEDEVIDAFVALADGAQGKLTERQTADVLKQAAAAARALKDYARADELSARIPIEAERKNAEMLTLLAQRKAKDVIERLGDEDLTMWPFWAAGEGYYARGRAYAALGDAAKAAADFHAALPLAGDERLRNDVRESLDRLGGKK